MIKKSFDSTPYSQTGYTNVRSADPRTMTKTIIIAVLAVVCLVLLGVLLAPKLGSVFGKKETEVFDNGSVVEYRYRVSGEKISATYYDAGGEKTAKCDYEYDKNHKLVRGPWHDENGVFGGVVEYTYGATDLRTKEEAYDTKGKIVSRTLYRADGSVSEREMIPENRTFYYKENGDISQLNDGGIVWVYRYDGNNRFIYRERMIDEIGWTHSTYKIRFGQRSLSTLDLDQTLTNCTGFEFNYAIDATNNGNPFGKFDLYVCDDTGRWIFVEHMNVLNNNKVTTKVSLASPINIEKMANVLTGTKKAGWEYTCTIEDITLIDYNY